MKILLVLPAAEQLRVTQKNREVPKRAMLRFSVLPLTTVAALTPPQHEVTICDENVEPLDFDADVDLVGITFMTAIANRAYEIAREFRAKGKLVVGGGFHPTLCPDEASEHFDALVCGDAERAWPKLLEDAEAGKLKQIYRNDVPCDLKEAPIPRRELTRKTSKHYVTVNAVQTGRGCSHGCSYCSIAAFHKKLHRSRPLENVLEDLRQVPRNFMFVDDNIIADPQYARKLFKAMIPLKKRWVSQCSLKIADDRELLRLAQKAGCRGLFIGIETISSENLEKFGKEFNESKRYRERLKAIKRAGIGIVAGIIVGADGDDVTVFERTLNFLQENRIDALQLNIMTPLPGTKLHEEFARRDRILVRDRDYYDFRHCVIRPARMRSIDLKDGADWLYRQFYRLDRILFRFVRGIFSLGPLSALLNLKLNLTYRYDNKREGITGRNPARVPMLRLSPVPAVQV
ncbi:MAG: B12-binding domain-containing radical SAM protein [Planctomycetota bacterium]|jgi:radical SAM superfamily enzyme YgiQ (UPF0313 family)